MSKRTLPAGYDVRHGNGDKRPWQAVFRYGANNCDWDVFATYATKEAAERGRARAQADWDEYRSLPPWAISSLGELRYEGVRCSWFLRRPP